MKRQQSSRDATNSRRQIHRSVCFAVLAALAAGVPASVHAEPIPWPHLCNALSDFAKRLTDYRNEGASLQEATTAALPTLRILPDRAMATEIARQVFATPDLSREQEADVIYTKCISLAENPSPSTRQPASPIKVLTAIPLQLGPNRIERFASDGRPADITLAWRDEGGRHGYDMFRVTIPNKATSVWRGVEIWPKSVIVSGNAITDDPHRGDDILRAVRFARGKVDDQDATLLLVVSRSESMDSTPTEAVYEVYRLVESDGRDGFLRIVRRALPGRYCNADMALSVASGLPLRTSYRGPVDAAGRFTKDGCHASPVMPAHARPLAADQPASASRRPAAGTPQQQQEKLFQQFSDWAAERRNSFD